MQVHNGLWPDTEETKNNVQEPAQKILPMKNIIGLLFLMAVLATSCKKDDDQSFSNSLKLGTGMSGFNLTGEGTSFSAGTYIYFRLECEEDMGGSPVRIKVTKSGTGTSTDFNFPSLQDYGHLYLSSFSVAEPGSYTATGILTASNSTIASISFTVQ